jgi:hypothetical protein
LRAGRDVVAGAFIGWVVRENHSIPRYVRLAALPRFNSSMVRAPGTDLLTVRIDLDPA